VTQFGGKIEPLKARLNTKKENNEIERTVPGWLSKRNNNIEKKAVTLHTKEDCRFCEGRRDIGGGKKGKRRTVSLAIGKKKRSKSINDIRCALVIDVSIKKVKMGLGRWQGGGGW